MQNSQLGQLLMEAKKYNDAKKIRDIVPDGDHVYYVAHKEPFYKEYNITKGENISFQDHIDEQLKQIIPNYIENQKGPRVSRRPKVTIPKYIKYQDIKQSPSKQVLYSQSNYEFINKTSKNYQNKNNVTNYQPSDMNYQYEQNQNVLTNKALEEMYLQNLKLEEDLVESDKQKEKKLEKQEKENQKKIQDSQQNEQQAISFLSQNEMKSKQSTIVDIKHPISEKTTNEKTGMVIMTTDLGSIEQNDFFNPLDQNSYKQALQRNKNEFLYSDNVKNNFSKKPNTYLDELNKKLSKTSARKGSVDKLSVLNKEKHNYNFQTDIDITSPINYAIRQQIYLNRVQTNNPFGVYVNQDYHKYGKTIHNYDLESQKNNKKKDDNQDSDKNKNDKDSNNNKHDGENQNDSKNKDNGCCKKEPCKDQKKCIAFPYYSTYVANSFLQKNQKKKQKKIAKLQKQVNITEIPFKQTQQSCCLVQPCFDIPVCRGENIRIWQNSFLQLDQKLSNNKSQQKIRRRTRFPDGQYNCVKDNLKENLNYYCKEEVSQSFQKYCKIFIEQINIFVESMLFQDSIESICQELYMC